MRQLLLVATVVALPFAAMADVAIESPHQRNVRVRGDARAYALVDGSPALTFAAEGPGELVLVLRQAFTPKMRSGRTRTEIVVTEDGREIQRLPLRLAAGGRWAGRRRGRPSAARELHLTVAAGTHVYGIKVTTPGHRVAVAPIFETASVDLALIPLVPLDDDPNAVPLAGMVSGEDDGADIPLAGMVSGEDDGGDIPLAGMVPGEDDGADIPLAALTSLEEIPLAPLATDDETAAGTALASLGPAEGRDVGLERTEAYGEGGVLIGAPIHGARTPRGRRGQFALALRALGSAHGLGGGTFGGGADLLVRTGKERRLAVGVSADLLPYRLLLVSGAGARSFGADVRTIPVTLTVAYTLGKGMLQWQGSLGAGLVHASFALDGGATGQGLMPGGSASLGVLLYAGPGALSISGRFSGGWGSISPDAGLADRSVLAEGPFGGAGLALGYQLEL